MARGCQQGWAPTEALRLTLAIILAMSAVKLWLKSSSG
jgi:hypothetical protein